MEQVPHGGLNPHTISLVMKEMVRRAIREIRRQHIIFEVQEKYTTYKTGVDLVTSADIAAQKIFVKLIEENFPLAGIIAEENFAKECTDEGKDYFFTVDPLDGTKAYARRQSHGIGTMVSFVYNRKVEGVCIGDIMTEEIYLWRPSSEHVHRISNYEVSEKIIAKNEKLSSQYILLCDDPRKMNKLIQKMTSGDSQSLFDNTEVTGGSIGISFARLWKGEVGGIILRDGIQAPWDTCPIVGISHKLGFVFLEIHSMRKDYSIIPSHHFPLKDNVAMREMLIVHQNNLDEVREWFKNYVS